MDRFVSFFETENGREEKIGILVPEVNRVDRFVSFFETENGREEKIGILVPDTK